MIPAALVALGGFLLEHADVVVDVAQAIADGSPKEAIKAAIRGVKVQAARNALADEFAAAAERDARFTRGRYAWEAYWRSLGRDFDTDAGATGSAWAALPDIDRRAWEAAADAAREA